MHNFSFKIMVWGMLMLLPLCNALAQAKNTTKIVQEYSITLNIKDFESKESLIAVSCILEPLGTYATSDEKGKAVLYNIPKGKYTLKIVYVGYKTLERSLQVSENTKLDISLRPLSLALDEVVVVATHSKAGESTGTHIGRQAIDHLQAVSLDDIMQLVPGTLMKETDLTSPSKLQIRTLETSNNTNIFGASVVLDGVPISNNGAISNGAIPGNYSVGTDLRQISADDIESVEVIQGIPSAEYGDLTSGLVIVHSKKGETPWKTKIKINPKATNFSIGKGFRLKNSAILNVSLDYAKAWSDPRVKTQSFNRYNTSLNYSQNLTNIWHVSTKLRYSLSKDWNGNDPDAIADGTFSKNLNKRFSFSHNGRFSLNKKFARTLSYTIGLRINRRTSRQTKIVPNPGAFLPILTSMESGYYQVPYMHTSYSATGGVISKPNNVFIKLGNKFALQSGDNMEHSFNIGADYSCDWNNGKGLYNDDEQFPIKPYSNGRPRPYYNIPSIHRVAAYLEDKFMWHITEQNLLTVQAGLRFSGLQPGSDLENYAISPRLNMSLHATKWLKLRAGIGWSSKTPGLNYLYPEKMYYDRLAANYLPQNKEDEVSQLLMYHTQVYDVEKNNNLENATSRKIELGADITLPNNRKLRIVAFKDRTPNGFGNLTEYMVHTSNYYTPSQGLIINPGQPTQVDWDNPARIDTVFTTKGRMGNTNVSINKGLEISSELGEIRPIKTKFYLSGSYMESVGYSNDVESKKLVGLPIEYSSTGTTPFKLLFDASLVKRILRRASTNLRVVTNIPELRMVASFSNQVIWYNYSSGENPARDPIAWVDTDLSYHKITKEMLEDENYFIKGISLQKQRKIGKDNVAHKAPITWYISGRLTKEIGNTGGISFYANNLFFYEPFLKNSVSNTLRQYNTNTFSFGIELFFKF